MKFRVLIQPAAAVEMEEAYLWIREQAPESAVRWFNGLLDAFETLETVPERCSLAPENEYFKEPIRQLIYGKRTGRYRILFTVQGSTVNILHVRHGARGTLKPKAESLSEVHSPAPRRKP